MDKAVDELADFHRVDRSGECWLWTKSVDTHGYGRICHDGRQSLAHRFFYQKAFGIDPTGSVVMHKCDTPRCVNPRHLVLGSQRDNIADRHAKGRNGAARGDQAPWSLMTSESVQELRDAFERGEARDALVERFGISKTQMYRIIKRESWRHI